MTKPPEVVRQLDAETNKLLANHASSDTLSDFGVAATPDTPGQFAAFIESQTELWSGVVKSSGIKPD